MKSCYTRSATGFRSSQCTVGNATCSRTHGTMTSAHGTAHCRGGWSALVYDMAKIFPVPLSFNEESHWLLLLIAFNIQHSDSSDSLSFKWFIDKSRNASCGVCPKKVVGTVNSSLLLKSSDDKRWLAANKSSDITVSPILDSWIEVNCGKSRNVSVCGDCLWILKYIF